ncbi:polysaccharide lyase family 14 protein [Amanita thiersii Skay4041]|uniref:Polysaccharide lyase family 14 protein n=1 Tax=Amanita thiersii Skay4041 TaxID=703135 RepID=A0A2A9NVZ3_9AGAR|nr:polysaccharide lyase family 14 protein [Amanita thiersii Skay4041]
MFSLRFLLFVLSISLFVSSRPLSDHSHIHRRSTTHNLHALHANQPVLRRRDRRCRSRNDTSSSVPPVVNTATLTTEAPISTAITTQSLASASSESSSHHDRPSSSTTSSASEPTRTQSGSNGPGGLVGGIMDALFPVGGVIDSWTTSSSADSHLPLSDETFRPKNLMSAIAPKYVNGPDGKRSMKVHFPRGSYTYKQPLGGVSFYAPGPSSVDLTTAKEATFGYSVYFEKGYAFNMGGKLPGLYGGNSDSEAVGCSGGRRSSACFSARLMWRTDGQGELYTYLPPFDDGRFAANRKQCNVPPHSDCNPTYGASIGRGAFRFNAGQWTTVSQRVRLNDVGQANGELELFVGGESVINVKGLILRDSAAGRLRGIQMQSFFGGSSPQWASPKDQDIYFSDFSLAVTKQL